MSAPIEKELNVDGHLKLLCERPGVIGYVIFNYEGIPMRHHPNIDEEKAVHYASLLNDYFNVTRKIITKDLKNISENSDNNDLETIRMRTKKGTEMILSWDLEFRCVVIQKCQNLEEYNNEEDDNNEES